jgi:hypothetical protein
LTFQQALSLLIFPSSVIVPLRSTFAFGNNDHQRHGAYEPPVETTRPIALPCPSFLLLRLRQPWMIQYIHALWSDGSRGIDAGAILLLSIRDQLESWIVCNGPDRRLVCVGVTWTKGSICSMLLTSPAR